MNKSSAWPGTDRKESNQYVLRLAFALLVILPYILVLHLNKQELLRVLTQGQLTPGGVAVAFLFIVSGLLITQSLLRPRSVFAVSEGVMSWRFVEKPAMNLASRWGRWLSSRRPSLLDAWLQ